MTVSFLFPELEAEVPERFGPASLHLPLAAVEQPVSCFVDLVAGTSRNLDGEDATVLPDFGLFEAIVCQQKNE